MQSYLKLIRRILHEGERRPNRTGIDTLAIPGMMFEHDMADGFPLLTTKRMFTKGIFAELEMFIKGITDKRWLQERGVHIWDAWCRPDKVAYANLSDPDQQERMRAEPDLGPIYGWQWRHFGADYSLPHQDYPIGYALGAGVDQLANVVEKLKTDPTDRRMIVSAWNPVDLPQMALPACHYAFQVLVIGGRLHLLWNQRSVDSALGLPFNIASYGLLLHLLATEAGMREGKLIGMLGDTHVYVNQIEGLAEQMYRQPYRLPTIHTPRFSSIFDWQYTDTAVDGYRHHPPIKFEIAV
jgi:thymidylate synthase